MDVVYEDNKASFDTKFLCMFVTLRRELYDTFGTEFEKGETMLI